MAKNQLNEEQTKIFESVDKSALIQRTEIAKSKNGGYYVAIFGKHLDYIENIKDFAADNIEGEIVSTMNSKSRPVAVIYTQDKPENIIRKIEVGQHSKFNQKIEKQKWWEKLDLIKVRGTIGNVGQVFMLLSGFFDSDKADKGTYSWNSRNGKAKIISATTSLVGNGMNSVMGVQRKKDEVRLQYTKKLVNKYFKSHDIELPSVSEKLTDQKDYSWLKQNSLKVSNGIKLIGKGAMTFAKRGDLKAHGYLSVGAKIITLLGKDEDPYHLEKDQTDVTNFFRKSNAIAGPMEWIANITLWAGALWREKAPEAAAVIEMSTPAAKGKWYQFAKRVAYHVSEATPAPQPVVAPEAKKSMFNLFDFKNSELRWSKGSAENDIQWFQLLGATAIFGSLTAKSLAPFTVKNIDVEEFTAHSTLGLAQVGPEKLNEEVSRLTAHVVDIEELPEMRKLGFAGTFAALADDLEFRQGMSVKGGSAAKHKEQSHQKSRSVAVNMNITINQNKVEKIEKQIAAANSNDQIPQEEIEDITRKAKRGEVSPVALAQASERQQQEELPVPAYLQDIKQKETTPAQAIRNGEHRSLSLEEAMAL